jgi:hypothetical protein
MPDTILRYKYVPVDDSFTAPFDKKGSLSIIKDGTMKFTHRKEFNDPFDCHPEEDERAIYKSISKNPVTLEERKHIDNIIIGIKGKLSPAQLFLERSKFRKKNEIDFKKNCLEEFDKYGICCLCRNPLNLLMWAHYAKHHTGFVIEFAIPTKANFPDYYSSEQVRSYCIQLLFPLLVKYEQEKPVITSGDGEETQNKKFLTKGKDWEYEQEERVIDSIRGHGVHAYDRKKILKSVIAGMRMSDDDFTILKNTVDTVNKEQGMNVTVHKAEPVKGKFVLTVPDRDDLNIHNI